MTFDNLLDLQPNVMLADLIQLEVMAMKVQMFSKMY